MREFGVGRPVARVEDDRFIRGLGSYTGDSLPAGAAAMYVVRSPYAAARILSIDVEGALDATGVIDVMTFKDIEPLKIAAVGSKVPHLRADATPYLATPYLPLAGDIAAYAGDAVAVVIAETLDLAKDAAERLAIDYEPLPFVVDALAALEESSPRVWPQHHDNACFDFRLGEAARCADAFARADRVVEQRFRLSRVSTSSIEGRAATGEFDGHSGRYVLRAGLQMPHEVGRDIAAALGVSPQDIHVISPDVGGGFGMKLALYQEYLLVLIAARRIGRPVRWQCERSEAFLSDQQARDNISDVALALDRNGKFLALKVRTVANLGAYVGQWSLHVPAGNLGGLAGVYEIDAFDVHVTGVLTNTVPVGPYRGAGRPEASYCIERIIERAALEMGIDAADLRRRNMIAPSAMPYRTGLVFTYDCGDFAAILDEAQVRADWAGFDARRAESERRGKLRGRGMAYVVESAGGPAPRSFDEYVEIRFDSSGRATILAGTHSHGQGHETVYRQFANEYLGLDFADVRVVYGDTDAVAHGRGSFGSRTMMAGGASFRAAADRVIGKGRRLAAHLMNTGVDDVTFEDGIFADSTSNKTLSLGDVARSAFVPFILPEDMEVGLTGASASFGGAISFPNACHICEIEIEPDTGVTTLASYVVVEDVGTVVNPLLLAGQIHGGVVQGVGQALMEEIVYNMDDGQLVTGSFMDYAMPRADVLGRISVHSHPVPTKLNPIGAKGAGEAGCVGALPAVMNAVGDALWRRGVSHFDMPAAPNRVWAALKDAAGSA